MKNRPKAVSLDPSQGFRADFATYNNRVRHPAILEFGNILFQKDRLASMMNQVILDIIAESGGREIHPNFLCRKKALDQFDGRNKIAIGAHKYEGVRRV